MENISQHVIKEKSSIREALIKLNNLTNRKTLTLFVVNDSDKMVGSLTDGDIRRKLISGISLEAQVKEAMHKTFKYILQNSKDVKQIREFKKLGINLLPYLDENFRIIDIFDLKENYSILPIDAVLMAGGKGERLRPLTEHTPKPLLSIGEKAIIDYNVDRLISYGVQHISVTVNYLKEQIQQHFSECRNGVQVNCVTEPEFLGTIGSIKFIDTFYNDAVLVMNSDLFTNIDYEEFYLHFIENNADMSVAAVPYSVAVPYGIFELEGRNIQGITEKPTYTYYANAGIYLIKKKLLNIIPDNKFFNATDFMETLIQQKLKVVRFPITGYWIDIGKKEDYQKAQEIAKHI